MKIASWNVNSIRARLAHLGDWLERQSPDIVGIQETKAQDKDFPLEDIRSFGYHAAFIGQKAYNGVAILSKQEPRDVICALKGAEQFGARYIAASFDDGAGGYLRFINAYVINGKEVGAQAYDDKLEFLARLTEAVELDRQNHENFAVVGDFNIAPEDIDVYDPDEWREKILCSSKERDCYTDLMSRTLCHDSLRELNPDDSAYTWWDYRGARYRRKQGMRIDHILLAPGLRSRCHSCWVDESTRKLDKPSDHAPVIAEIDQ